MESQSMVTQIEKIHIRYGENDSRDTFIEELYE